MNQQETFCFTHITDPHLSSLANVRISQLLNKRLLGYLSWKTRRQYFHLRSIVDELVIDMKTVKPDHVVISGDLTHIGLPEEFDQVADWLRSISTTEQITVIPGNHETYTKSDWQSTFAKWHEYLASDTDMTAERNSIEFPTLRIRKQIAFIGLNSAYPSAPFLATGKLGKRQLVRLGQLLEQTVQQNLFRVVIVHHPPVQGMTKWRKRLKDTGELQQVLRQYGAELVLFGHTHKTDYRELDTKAGITPLASVSSASSASAENGRQASYAIFRVTRLPSGQWTMSRRVRQYQPRQKIFVDQCSGYIT